MMLILPKKDNLYKPHPKDPVHNYYRVSTQYVFRKRLKLFLSLIEKNRRYMRVLELGYGSGIFLPSLGKIADTLYALDSHDNGNFVSLMCRKEGVKCILLKGLVQSLPFKKNTFDLIVSVSVYQQTSSEILDASMPLVREILKEEGIFVCGLPVKNLITDSWLLSEGFNPRLNAPVSHKQLLSCLKKYFYIDKILKFPNFLPLGLSLYIVIKARKNKYYE